MTVSTARPSVLDVESFMTEYYAAWGGTDEDRIMSYYAENVTVQIPGILMQGKSAVRDQFVSPFITGFPGNRHVIKSMIFGRDAVVVEFSFDAEHKGSFAGHAATDAHVEVAGCGVYEYDSAKRQITAARIYFDVQALLKQITDPRYPRSRSEETASSPAVTIAAPVEHLDVATVIAVSQAVSGEVALEKLLDTLMRTAGEHAGAERALLILSQEASERIAAEATSSNGTVMVCLRDEAVTGTLLPETVFRHVLRTRESVILDDAAILNPFSTDPYIAQRHPRSIFCLPLMHQAKCIGVLYLENTLAPCVFAPARTAVLKLLASQAAISLENSRLYRDLANREARIRRLWDSNILGICVWDLDGAVVSANEEFLRMLQYDRDDVVSGRLRWTDLTPSEWREQNKRAVAELRSTGAFQPVEKEYFRKDGSRVPVLIGGALFEGSGNQGVAFVLDLTERKRVEEALRESERRLRSVIDRIPGLVAIMAPNGEVEAVNRQILEYYGQTLEELRNWDTSGVIHPEDLPCVKESMERSIASGVPFEFEHRARRFDGEYRWLFTRGVPFRDGSGRIDRWYALVTDIEERKRAEEALRKSEQSSRSALDGIPGLVAILGPNGGVEVVNRQIVEYCGRPLEELKNWGTNGTIYHEDLPHLADVFTRSIASGVPYEIEARVRRFDGEHRWFDIRGIPVRDVSDRIVRWYTLLTDINERKRAEKALQSNERNLSLIINTIPTNIYVLNPEGSVLYVNQAVMDHTGLTLEDVQQEDYRDRVIHPEDFKRVRAERAASLRRGAQFSTEQRVLGKDGQYRWFLVRYKPLLDEQGGIVQWYVAASDIEDRKRAEEALSEARGELARAERVMTLGALTASIAHEVNQPLSGIITNAGTCLRMLGADPPNLDGARATAQRTLRDGNRASEIIQRLRAMFAHKERTAERVDLNEAAREVLALTASELQRRGVFLRTDFDEGLPAIAGDRVQLQQVILNLVLNAADAMKTVDDRSRDLLITTDRDEADRICLSVRDAGVGVDPLNLEKLFQAFYTTKSHGMGVGLSISRSIIESHGGRIWATNNDGPGAIFAFSIPVLQCDRTEMGSK